MARLYFFIHISNLQNIYKLEMGLDQYGDPDVSLSPSLLVWVTVVQRIVRLVSRT